MRKPLLLAIVLAFVTANLPAKANPPRLENELALAIGKVCVNEAGWHAPADCVLIWQATRRWSSTTAGRLAWLRSHSGRVLGTKKCTTGNCLWTQNLTWSDDRPEGLVGLWRPEWWARVRELAQRLVRGEETRTVCSEDPATWGGPADHARAMRLGFTALDCEGTLNEGYLH